MVPARTRPWWKGEHVNGNAVSVETQQNVPDAINRHDLEVIMAYFAEDAVFEPPRGPDPWETRFIGEPAVREGLALRFRGIPEVRYCEDRHVISGDRGVSEWLSTGTTAAGKRIEVRGCNLGEFRDGLEIRKDSYWKIV